MEHRRTFRFICLTLLLITAVLTCPLPAAAQEKMTAGPNQIGYQFSDVSIPEGRLAFTLTNKDNADIYVADFKKLEVYSLVTGPATDEYPSWSQDGRKLVFTSDRDNGDRELYTVDADGSNLTRLTKSPGPDEDPNWSADGKKIAFASSRAGKGINIFTMSPDGSNLEQLTDTNNNNTVPKWSPRNDELLYSTNAYWPGWDIMLYDVATHQPKVMTRGYQSFCRGSFNPDATQFVFSYGSAKDIDLWIQHKGESRPAQLTEMEGREYDGIYIDDSHVLYVADEGDDAGQFQLWTINTTSKKFAQVLKIDGSIRYLSFTPFPTADAIAEDLKNGEPVPADVLHEAGAGSPAVAPTMAPSPTPVSSPAPAAKK